MIKVLFVCLGNICRSPMAEAVLRHKVKEKGLSDRISVDSAGTAGYHIGEPPHKGTREILDRYGISYEGMTARKLSKRDINEFEYIIAMDDSNLKDIQSFLGKSNKIKMLSDYCPDNPFGSVPDPWYSGDFDETYNLVDRGCEAVLHSIIKNKI